MFCNKCGTQVPEGTSFCPNCGNYMKAATPAGNSGYAGAPASGSNIFASLPRDTSKKSILFYCGLATAVISVFMLLFQKWVSASMGGFSESISLYDFPDNMDGTIWAILALITSFISAAFYVVYIIEALMGRQLIKIQNVRTSYLSAGTAALTFIFVLIASITMKSMLSDAMGMGSAMGADMGMGGLFAASIKIGPSVTAWITLILAAGHAVCDFLFSKEA